VTRGRAVAPERLVRRGHLFAHGGFDRFGEALQRRQRSTYAMVALAADAGIEQHFQAHLPGQFDDVHDTPPR
jgi:hypothetical protein